MKNKQIHSFGQMENETGQVNQSFYASPIFRCFYFAHMATYQNLVYPKFILHQFGPAKSCQTEGLSGMPP